MIEPGSLALQADSLLSEPSGKLHLSVMVHNPLHSKCLPLYLTLYVVSIGTVLSHRIGTVLSHQAFSQELLHMQLAFVLLLSSGMNPISAFQFNGPQLENEWRISGGSPDPMTHSQVSTI